jgi:hypothetical protein
MLQYMWLGIACWLMIIGLFMVVFGLSLIR